MVQNQPIQPNLNQIQRSQISIDIFRSKIETN